LEKLLLLVGCNCPYSIVSGSSMDDTFRTRDYVLVDKLTYYFRNPKAGDVVVFNPPLEDRTKDRFIKRVIATPGETIDVTETATTINSLQVDEPFVTHTSNRTAHAVLGPDEYFVMGDNRAVSFDSRAWGPIKKEEVQGRVLIRLYPFNQISIFPGFFSRSTK
jgi:signal peptidase I